MTNYKKGKNTMIKPLNENILIKFVEEEKEKKESLIIVYEKENNNPIQKAKIIDCGKNASELIKENAEILINKYAAVKVPYDNETFYIINVNDIVAVV